MSRGLNQLAANKQRVQNLEPKYQPVFSKRVAILEPMVKDIVNEYYNLISGARELMFAGAFGLDYYSREDERKLPLEKRLRVDVKLGSCSLSDGGGFRELASVFREDNVVVERQGRRITFTPARSVVENFSVDDFKRLGSLEIAFPSDFFRVNVSDGRAYITAYPSLAKRVELCGEDTTKVVFACTGIPHATISTKEVDGATEYVLSHSGYYNLDVMAQRSLDTTLAWLGDYEQYLPSAAQLVEDSCKGVGLKPWVLQKMQAECFFKAVGIERPQELRSLYEVARSAGSYQFVTIDGSEDRVKVLTDQLVETLLQKRLAAKEVLFNDFCLNPTFVSNFLEYNRTSKIAKPLAEEQLRAFSAFVEACSEGEQVGLSAGAAKLVQAYCGKELGSEVDFAAIKEELSVQSVEEVVQSRLSDFEARLPDCVRSQELCREITDRLGQNFGVYVELIASDSVFLAAPMSVYANTLTPFLLEAELEDRYAFERPSSERVTAGIGGLVELIAKTIDVPKEVLEATNGYYNQVSGVLVGLGQARYEERQAAAEATAEEAPRVESFQERGYGAVDPNSNPYDKLAEGDQNYVPMQDAQGNWFAQVGGQRVPLTAEVAQALLSANLPEAELSGLSEIPSSPAKKEAEKAKRAPSRGKRREQVAGD